MKKLVISSAMLWITITLFSCKGDSDSRDVILNHYKKIYDFSISNNDYITAEGAIYNEWALDSANASSYKDTLAVLYFKNGQFVQAIKQAKDILTKKPDDQVIIEILADADQNINNVEEALYYYKIIYSKDHDLFHLYKIAISQFDLGSMDECNQTIDQLLDDTGSLHQTVPIAVDGQVTTQNVPYKAAAFNIRGVVAKNLKQTDVARKAFNDALAIAPDFELAKHNLDDLNKQK